MNPISGRAPGGSGAGSAAGPSLTLAGRAELVSALSRALAGDAVVAPVPAIVRDDWLAALRPGEPAEIQAGVIVASSGSTGPPKFVLLTADAILASVTATHERLGGPGDWVCVLPTQHVAGLMTVARAVAAGTPVRFGCGDLSDLPVAGARSYLSLVPAQLWRARAESSLAELLRGYAAVLVGGSAVDPGLLAWARDAGIAAVTTYGMAETCGGCVYDGHPLRGVEIRLDSQGRISVTAPLVFSGYRHRPADTAETLHGATVRTRDRGRIAPDGRLEVIGRTDEVVVSGGVNVDLAEAQQVSDAVFGPAEHGGVLLLGIIDQRWGTRVVAVTTGKAGLAEVRAALGERLGPAALPQELRRVPQLAYTATGKIDRVAMRRDWEREGSDGHSG